MKIDPILIAKALDKKKRVICIVVNGKSIHIFLNDKSKTSPYCERKYKDGTSSYTHHAEMRALSKLKNESLKNLTFYVVRTTSQGMVAMARPCDYCREKFEKMGIKSNQIYYTDWDGNITKDRW